MNKQTKKAHRRSDAPAHQTHHIKVEDICLILFGLFCILFIGGYYINNVPLTYLGIGLGFAAFVIQVHLNLSEEDDDYEI